MCEKVTDTVDMGITPADQMMTDNSDGTYSATYSSNVDGIATVQVFYYSSGVYVEFFADKVFTQPPASTATWTQVNENWGSGNIFGAYSDNVSVKIHFMIKAPTSEDYEFWLESDDGADLYMNEISKITQMGNTCTCNNTFTETLTAGQYYDFR
jgi:hypothetical protein